MLGEFELWWLLSYPAIFGLGWLAARIDLHHVIRNAKNVPIAVYQGLSALLAENMDQAVNFFSQALHVDHHAYELRFALGTLFRKRGEFERSIEIHREIFSGSSLSEEMRKRACYALAQDYLHAGIFNQAEELLEKLVTTNEHALVDLLHIYCTKRDWQKTVNLVKKIPGYSLQLRRIELAQFYCELALQKLTHSQYDQARQHLNEALHINSECIRANIILGDIEKNNANYELALTIWQRIEKQDGHYIALVCDRIISAYDNLDKNNEALNYLEGVFEQYPNNDILQNLFCLMLRLRGKTAAMEFMRQKRASCDGLLGSALFLDVFAMDLSDGKKQDLKYINDIVTMYAQKISRYCCNKCGFSTRTYDWKCPGCNHWETYCPTKIETISN